MQFLVRVLLRFVYSVPFSSLLLLFFFALLLQFLSHLLCYFGTAKATGSYSTCPNGFCLIRPENGTVLPRQSSSQLILWFICYWSWLLLVTFVSTDTNEDEVEIFDFAAVFFFCSQHTDGHAFREGRKGGALTFNTLWMNMLCTYGDTHPPPTTTTQKKKEKKKKNLDYQEENNFKKCKRGVGGKGK